MASVSVAHQRSAFSYAASVEGVFAQTHAGRQTAATRHGTLHMALRTPTIYADSAGVGAQVGTAAPGFGARAAATLSAANEKQMKLMEHNQSM